MTIHLPENLEASLLEAVRGGQFASVDDAMAEAARLLIEELGRRRSLDVSGIPDDPPTGFIGALREDAELLDQAVEHAMRGREERPWRLNPVE